MPSSDLYVNVRCVCMQPTHQDGREHEGMNRHFKVTADHYPNHTTLQTNCDMIT